MKFEDTARLAREALDATGAKTHGEFIALVNGAIALRSFRRFLSGDAEAPDLVRLVLTELRDGWRPGGRVYSNAMRNRAAKAIRIAHTNYDPTDEEYAMMADAVARVFGMKRGKA